MKRTKHIKTAASSLVLLLLISLCSIEASSHAIGRNHVHHEGFGNTHYKNDSKDKHKHHHTVLLGIGPDIVTAYEKNGVLYLIMGNLSGKCHEK